MNRSWLNDTAMMERAQGEPDRAELESPTMNAARRTLGRWILATLLERGCDPTTARLPRRVTSVRPLTRREMAELRPFTGALIAGGNLLPLPRPVRRAVYEV
jgi:hypothetical protein